MDSRVGEGVHGRVRHNMPKRSAHLSRASLEPAVFIGQAGFVTTTFQTKREKHVGEAHNKDNGGCDHRRGTQL